eukprot:XP_003633363.2 PREDICTED: receptor-like protein 12 [Vitis vinifera]
MSSALTLSHVNLQGLVDSNSILFKLHNLLMLDFSWNFDLAFNLDSEKVIPTPFGFSLLPNLSHLNLAYTGFSGQVPLQMSHLTKLVFLDFSGDGGLKLESPNLKELVQNMSNLKELLLDQVSLSSQNSDWFKALSYAAPNLSVLSLSGCSISGPLDSLLSNLHFLSEIDLSLNNLSSEVPDFLANFTSLVSLDLSYCGLHGEFPMGVFRLPNLQNIDISSNPELVGLLPEFPEHSALSKLLLSDTRFHGKLPESIGHLQFLNQFYINSCNFTGTIPNSLGNLSQLQFLSLSSNNFGGSIPSSIANLTQLQVLALSSNHLSGSIPSLVLPRKGLLSLLNLELSDNLFDGVIDCSLFTLPSLNYLSLAENFFRSLPPEGSCKPSSSLGYLNLSYNVLQGPIPGLITELKSLQELYLSSNEFNGSLDLGLFSNFTNLTYLDLSDNLWSVTASPNLIFPQLWSLKLRSCSVKKFPTFLRNLQGLGSLDLSRNGIMGQIPIWIWMSSLVSLNLSDNSLTGLDGPLPNASTLQLSYLDLHSNNIKGSLPILWHQYPMVLDFSNNSFSSFIPDDIGSYFDDLVFFSVASNKLIGEIPASICSAGRLEVLDLSNNSFNGTIPRCIGNFSAYLSILNLGKNGFQGTLPQTFANTLNTLVFNGNQLEGTVPRSLSDCNALEVLDIGNNWINDTFPFWLENLPQLRVLILRSNKFHGKIGNPQTRNAFPMLHVIDLSSNDFTGDLASEYFYHWKAMMKVDNGKSGVRYLGKSGYYYSYSSSVKLAMKGFEFELQRILDIFTAIDLSNNEFEGKIPDSIGELKSLHVLDLSNNSLEGPIPSSLENLSQLESLDFSDNRLSGRIPWQLTRLTFLSFMNLARNDLEGTIPSGGQFNTFPATYYEGNPRLCGFPLSRKCEAVEEALPPIQQDLDSDSSSEFDWKFAGMGYGCGVVAGLSIGYILFWGNGVFSQSFTLQKHHPRMKSRRRRSTS